MTLEERFEFRYIRPEEAEEACDIEEECFPGAEYCSREEITERVVKTPESFFVAADREKGCLAGFLTYAATDEESVKNEFFSHPECFDSGGKNAVILGLDIRPSYQRRGIGTALMKKFCELKRQEGRKKVILTCHEDKITMYEKLGFRNLGISESDWGGEIWTEMDLVLTERKMNPLSDDIIYLTERALWETENLIACIPDTIWNRRYDGIPLWKYLYHMLYSMDRWFINPDDPAYRNPDFHVESLADLNVVPKEEQFLSKEQEREYFLRIKKKIQEYLDILTDDMLSECPEGCDMSRLRLIIGQHRHWHRHMGIVYGFVIADTGKWPYVLNMNGEYPGTPMPNFYE